MADPSTPASILIIGSGVFGLSTAYSLALDPAYSSSSITVLDKSAFPAPDGSSVDTSRIVRADYADLSYAALALEAQDRWRHTWWGDNVYHEDGLVICIKHAAAEKTDLLTAAAADDRPRGEEPNTTGVEYMRASLANVKRLGLREPEDVAHLSDPGAIRALVADASSTTDDAARDFDAHSAYINRRSGWVHATHAMEQLRSRLAALDRVTFLTGRAVALRISPSSGTTDSTPRVTGVALADGTHISAALTILATGAWTPTLLDLRGRASATGQVLGYMTLSAVEQERVSRNPTVLNESTGLFIITPANGELKVARHGYGYANPVRLPGGAERGAGQREDADGPGGEGNMVSVPWTEEGGEGRAMGEGGAAYSATLPAEAEAALRGFLRHTYPSLAERSWSRTRICWYTDTPTGDWIVDYHPGYEGLFVATGGSGHAFKFAPVVGDCVVKRIKGEKVGKGLDEKWDWPERKAVDDDELSRLQGHVWTEDWRGGKKGMILSDEFKPGT